MIPFLAFTRLQRIIPIRAILQVLFDCLVQLEGTVVFRVFSKHAIFPDRSGLQLRMIFHLGEMTQEYCS
jgi:hypothetical protein